MRSILGILCAVMILPLVAKANSVTVDTADLTLTVPTQTVTFTSPGPTFNLSSSISDSTATSAGHAMGFAPDPLDGPNSENEAISDLTLNGNASAESVVDFSTIANTSFLNWGHVLADPSSNTTLTVTLDQIVGSTSTQVFSFSVSSSPTSTGYQGFEANSPSVSQQMGNYELDVLATHAGPGSGAAYLSFSIAPVPTSLYGSLALFCLGAGLKLRKRRLNA